MRCIFEVEGDFKFQIGTQCQFVQIRGLPAPLRSRLVGAINGVGRYWYLDVIGGQ